MQAYNKCVELAVKFTNILDSFFHKNDITEDATNVIIQKDANTQILIPKNVGGGKTTEDITLVLSGGKTIGNLKHGDVVPSDTDLQGFINLAGRELVNAVFNAPTTSLSGNPAPTSNREVGESLTINLTATFNQRDGGASTGTVITKNGSNLAGTQDTIVLTTSNVSYQASISYDAGTGTKPNSLGQQEANTITAGTVNSNTLNYRGYRAVFYGSHPTKNTVSNTIRTNLTKRLENSGNSFVLNTGNANTKFQLWLPNGKNLVSVVDLDALNANITSSYVSEAKQVADANGTLINGTLYTMSQAVPYASNHRHQITIS